MCQELCDLFELSATESTSCKWDAKYEMVQKWLQYPAK